jgi:hypothetical protein
MRKKGSLALILLPKFYRYRLHYITKISREQAFPKNYGSLSAFFPFSPIFSYFPLYSPKVFQHFAQIIIRSPMFFVYLQYIFSLFPKEGEVFSLLASVRSVFAGAA